MFLDNNWIDVDQLKEFLERAASDLHPIAPESPTTRVKLESDASITRLTTLEGETAVGPTGIRTKAVHECESPVGKYGLIRGKTRGVIKQVAGHDEGMVAHSDMFSTHFIWNIIITCAKCTCEYFKLCAKPPLNTHIEPFVVEKAILFLSTSLMTRFQGAGRLKETSLGTKNSLEGRLGWFAARQEIERADVTFRWLLLLLGLVQVKKAWDVKNVNQVISTTARDLTFP
ncbi:hypothetical protein B0H10DRAFT_2195484 [Mycena sp. CBHHK59/15]|nr:hypothetical protein B0H10DRAFT_2195484 [Mycena sp. CBHHK59/15]